MGAAQAAPTKNMKIIEMFLQFAMRMAELLIRACLDLFVSLLKALGSLLVQFAGRVGGRPKPLPVKKTQKDKKPRYNRRRKRKENPWRGTLH